MSEKNNTPLQENIEQIKSVDTHSNIKETLASLVKLHPGNENIQAIQAMTDMFGENQNFLKLIHSGVEKLHDKVKIVEGHGKRKASNIHKNMIAQLETIEKTYDDPNSLLQAIS